jgi:hypothetical protein
MPDNRNPKNDNPYEPSAAADRVRVMDDAGRQAFLAEMSEQQRQFAAMAVRRADVRDAEREMGKQVHQQQNTGNHDKPETEKQGSDQRGGTRAGAENVEPKRR